MPQPQGPSQEGSESECKATLERRRTHAAWAPPWSRRAGLEPTAVRIVRTSRAYLMGLRYVLWTTVFGPWPSTVRLWS